MPFLGDMLVPRRVLVGGWTNPSEKYARQIGSSPKVSSKVLWIAKLLILPLLASFDKVFKPKCTWSLHSNDNGHPSLLQIHDEGFAGKAGICDNLCQCVTSLFLLNSLSWQFCFLHSFVTSPITSVDPQWHRFHACTSDIESFGPDCMAKSAQKTSLQQNTHVSPSHRAARKKRSLVARFAPKFRPISVPEVPSRSASARWMNLKTILWSTCRPLPCCLVSMHAYIMWYNWNSVILCNFQTCKVQVTGFA